MLPEIVVLILKTNIPDFQILIWYTQKAENRIFRILSVGPVPRASRTFGCILKFITKEIDVGDGS